jgi:hypothetical protein
MAIAQLKITKADGEISHHDISPLVQYKFEKAQKKSVTAIDSQSDIYYLAWIALHGAGQTVPPFGEAFVALLESVEVVDGNPL